ncbi:unnamed protein product [Strongylus vulgaris]|uniref:Aminoglycoside phosphotransferase domain-containing protein n=1 Tax=Strongylus vulgaris TaxID=40348 RepID=A0A3P7IZL5_STRVU|nr:unnamed protein product [Strongylus vulgaris]
MLPKATYFTELSFSAALHNLTGYEDCNFLLDDVVWEGNGPQKAILKVTNPLEAKTHKNIDFQVKLCELLNENDIPCPKIIKRLDGRKWALEEVVDGENDVENGTGSRPVSRISVPVPTFVLD